MEIDKVCDPKEQVLKAKDMKFEKAKCSICWQPYTYDERAPISLTCGHAFCCQCIQGLVQGTHTIVCAVCRQQTMANPKKLPKDYYTMNLLEQFDELGGTEREKLIFKMETENNLAPTTSTRDGLTPLEEAKVQVASQIVCDAVYFVKTMRENTENLIDYAVSQDCETIKKLLDHVKKIFKKAHDEMVTHPLQRELNQMQARTQANSRRVNGPLIVRQFYNAPQYCCVPPISHGPTLLRYNTPFQVGHIYGNPHGHAIYPNTPTYTMVSPRLFGPMLAPHPIMVLRVYPNLYGMGQLNPTFIPRSAYHAPENVSPWPISYRRVQRGCIWRLQ